MRGWMCEWMCACMCACVHVCMCACVHVCMCACVHVWMCACVDVRRTCTQSSTFASASIVMTSLWHVANTTPCVTWLIHICDMTHSYMWHDSFLGLTLPWHVADTTPGVPWLIHICDMTYMTWPPCVTSHRGFIHICDIHSYVCHASGMCACMYVLSHIRMKHVTQRCHVIYDMTPLYPVANATPRVPWLIHICDMSHSHDWRCCSTLPTSTHSCETRAIHICDMTWWIVLIPRLNVAVARCRHFLWDARHSYMSHICHIYVTYVTYMSHIWMG